MTERVAMAVFECVHNRPRTCVRVEARVQRDCRGVIAFGRWPPMVVGA